jgi:formiminotetrahydrofolate cyclodeaminase
MLRGETLETFLDRLASADPTPGGGSVAALCGALAAALGSMVANLTHGKPKYAAVQEEIGALLQHAEQLRARFTNLIEADVAAFDALSTALRLPRTTEEEIRARRERVQAATRAATETPLAVAERAAEVVSLCERLLAIGNRNVLSDVGVAAVLTRASAESASFNVLVNLLILEDAAYKADVRARLDAATARVEHATVQLIVAIKDALS